MLGFLQNLGRNGPFNTSPLTPGINGSLPAIGPRRLPRAPRDYPIDESTAQDDQRPSDYELGYSALPPAPESLPGSAAASSNSSQATANGWEDQAVENDNGESAPPDRATPQQQSVQRQQVSEDMPYDGSWSQRDNPDNFEPEGDAGSPEAQAAGRSELTPWIPPIATVAAPGAAAQQPQQPQPVQRRPVAPAIKPLPERPKPGILRQLAGAVVGNWVPPIGQKITYGDYPGQVADWNATMAGIERQKKMEVAAQREQSEATLRMSQAAHAQAQADDLRRGKVTSLGYGVGVDASGNIINPNPRLPPPPRAGVVMMKADVALARLGYEIGKPDEDGYVEVPQQLLSNRDVAPQAKAPPASMQIYETRARATLPPGASEDQVWQRMGELQNADRAKRPTGGGGGTPKPNEAALNRLAQARAQEILLKMGNDADTTGVDHKDVVKNLRDETNYVDMSPELRQRVIGIISADKNKANGKKGSASESLRSKLSGGAAGPQATAQPSVSPKQPPAAVKTVTMNQIREAAKANNKTEAQVKEIALKQGNTVVE